MKALATFIILNILFISCSQQPEKQTDFSVNNIDSFLKVKNSFFSVYELSSKTTAITIELNPDGGKGILDSIFNAVASTDSIGISIFIPPYSKKCNYYDTSGVYALLKNKKLETEIKKHFDTTYSVYGTKGVQKVNIKDVLVSLEQCKTNIIALSINKFDTLKYGHPLICSSKLIQLNYREDYREIERKINQFYEKQ